MKKWLFPILLILLPGLLQAAESETGATRTGPFPADYREVSTEPVVGEGIQKYAPDDQAGPQKNFGVQSIHDNQVFATFMAERFEHQWREKDIEVLLWDIEAWFGNDYNKLYLESEGEVLLDRDRVEEAELEILYSRNIAKFWDLQAGIRHDFRPRPARSFLAFGVQGLAPFWFEIDATAYLSEDGDLSAALEAEYELMLTQRLVLVPRLETTLSAQDVPKYEMWDGVTDLTVGARLHYQIRRELAPYIGLTWTRKLGETADRIEEEGEDIDSGAVVAGVRFWF